MVAIGGKLIALRWRFQMLRVVMLFAMLLLTVKMAAAAPAAHQLSGATGAVIKGPIFRYTIKEGRKSSVCKHMVRVFNDKFSHLWDAPPLPWLKSDHDYSAHSEYAFPRLPGVEHSTKATFEMRFSAWSTSPEFSAIHWKEGRAVPGGCPAGKVCAGEGSMPILVAYFDFDNDGSIDTVIKSAFHNGKYFPVDILEVWRGQKLKIAGTPSLWDLEHPQDKKLAPISLWGTYLRPFIYNGVTYIAAYDPNFGNESPPPWYSMRKDMLIERYYFAGQKDQIGRPEWSSDTVCGLQMQRLNFR
jgi:hypothetical protein